MLAGMTGISPLANPIIRMFAPHFRSRKDSFMIIQDINPFKPSDLKELFHTLSDIFITQVHHMINTNWFQELHLFSSPDTRLYKQETLNSNFPRDTKLDIKMQKSRACLYKLFKKHQQIRQRT